MLVQPTFAAPLELHTRRCVLRPVTSTTHASLQAMHCAGMCCIAQAGRSERRLQRLATSGSAQATTMPANTPAPEMSLKPSRTILTLLAAGLLLAATAQAQTKPAKPTAKAARPAAKAPPKKAAPIEAPLAKAEGEQLAAAAMTHFGDYACEFDQAVSVNLTPNNDGYVDVRFKTHTWTMKPVLSSTGALRLEDVKGQMLMLQIANKSMLMDTRLGQRVVDGCVHEKQRLAIAAAASQPAGEALLQSAAAPASAPK